MLLSLKLKGTSIRRSSRGFIAFMFFLSLISICESRAEKDHTTDASPNSGGVVLHLDQINYDIAKKINKFIGKNPDKKKELVSLLIKFTENVEEIKRLLARSSNI